MQRNKLFRELEVSLRFGIRSLAKLAVGPDAGLRWGCGRYVPLRAADNPVPAAWFFRCCDWMDGLKLASHERQHQESHLEVYSAN